MAQKMYFWPFIYFKQTTNYIMHIKMLSFVLFLTSLTCLQAQKSTKNQPVEAVKAATENTNKMDSVSYSLGVLLASSAQQQGFDEIDVPSLVNAIEDVFGGETPKYDPTQANEIIQKYMADKQASQYGAVKEEGEAFLVENKKRPEVITTESGLQYEILLPGNGVKPTAKNKVTVHYHGTLIDGTVFDSSVERSQPATFGVTQVIQGWVEGLQLMPLGAKYKFFIPYDLAYGERAAGAKIPPFSALVFDVELLEIN